MRLLTSKSLGCRLTFTAVVLSFLIAGLPSIGISQTAQSGTSEAIYAPLKMEEGTWDADITFYEADNPSGQTKGVQTNTLLTNSHWLVNQFKIPATEKFPAYEGHGVWGYDPVAKTYVDTWVDTNDLAVRTDYGFWQEAEKTMTWSSKQNDGKGNFIDYRIVEEFKGDTRVLTFYQLGLAKPNAHPLIKMVFKKRPPQSKKGAG